MHENIKKDQKGILQWPQCKIYFQKQTILENSKTLFYGWDFESWKNYLECKLVKFFVQNLGIDDLISISSNNDTVTIKKSIEKYQN